MPYKSLVYLASFSALLFIAALYFSFRFFSAYQAYQGNPSDDVLIKKKNKFWQVANILWLTVLGPLIIILFLSTYSPLLIAKQYYSVGTIIVVAIPLVAAIFKQIKYLKPALKQPAINEVPKQFFFSFIKGAMICFALAIIYFFITNKEYREGLKKEEKNKIDSIENKHHG